MKKPLFIALFLSILAGFYLWDGTSSASSPATESGSGTVKIGGDFTLTDHTGKEVHDSDYRGRVMLVFFGFTHCPDICPVTTAVLSKTLDQLGADADKVAPLFITVDPKRDTADVLKTYLANFNSHLIGLTGSPEQIKAVVDAYKAYAAVVANDEDEHEASEGYGHHHDDDYMVDHSGYVYLMGKDGVYIRHFPYNVSEKELTEALKPYLK